MVFKSVVFPAPLLPRRQAIFPFSTCRETLRRTITWSSYWVVTPSSLSILALRSQIRLDDPGIPADGGIRPFGDLAAVVKNINPLGNLFDHRHIMLDYDHPEV